MVRFLDDSHSDQDEVVSQSSFNLHFSDGLVTRDVELFSFSLFETMLTVIALAVLELAV